MADLLGAALDRHWQRHPAQLGLAVLGLALGMALVVGMDLARSAARRALQAGDGLTASTATHQLLGGPGGLAADDVARLRGAPGWRTLAPVIERVVHLEGHGGRSLRLIGFDPLAEASLRPALGLGLGGAGRSDHFIAEPGAAVIASELAEACGLPPDGALTLRCAGRRQHLHLVGLLPPGSGFEDHILVDIATAQELAGITSVDRLDLILDDVAAFAAVVPDQARLVSQAERSAQLDRLTGAFELNLTALSLLALLVGCFLVRSTIALALLQRRPLIALLRAQGATAGACARRLLGELLLIGAVAALLGLGLGRWLAELLLASVATTINDLYGSVDLQPPQLGPVAALSAVALATLAAVLAGIGPLREALRLGPRQAQLRSVLEQDRQERLPVLLGAAGAATFAAIAALVLDASATAAFVAQGLLLVAGACLTPPLLRLGVLLLRPLAGRLGGPIGALAVRNIAAGFSRTALAATALTLALATALAVAVLISSFRQAVDGWLRQTLYADVYVLGSGARVEQDELPPQLGTLLPDTPGVARWIRNRSWRPPGSLVTWSAISVPPEDLHSFTLLAGVEAEIARHWTADQEDPGLIVSEPYARRHGVTVGDRLEIVADEGPLALPVRGICRDYGREHGIVYLHSSVYEAHWADRGLNALGFWATAGLDAATLAARLQERIADPGVRVVVSDQLRRQSLTVFDRTFAVTAVMRQLALLVALVGLAAALTGLALQRGREALILRSAGWTRRQLAALLTGESALLGLLAGLIGIPLGLVLSLLMLDGITLRSFGWSIPLHLDPLAIWPLPLWAAAVGALAGFGGAAALARRATSRLLQED